MTLPAGTRFSVRIPPEIPELQPGESRIEGELAAPIVAFAETIVPRGAPVTTVITNQNEAGTRQFTLKAIQFKLKGGKLLDIVSDEARLFDKEPRQTESRRAGFVAATESAAERVIGFRLREPVAVTLEPALR